MLTNACQTGHMMALDVQRHCRTFLVQTVLAPHGASLRASLLSRSVGFFRGLLASPSQEVADVALLAARHLRSSLGSNLDLVRDPTRLNPWKPGWAEFRAALEAADLGQYWSRTASGYHRERETSVAG